MNDETGALLPRTLFVGLSTPEFNQKVREMSEVYFDIVDSAPPTGVAGGPLLRGPGVIPHAAVVVAFSPAHSELPQAKTIDEVVTAFPESKYFFVFPDSQARDPLQPFIDGVLNGRASDRTVTSLRNFISLFEGRHTGIASAEAFDGGREVVSDEITVTFDPSLSGEQIKATLEALANYYRACGGVGLPAEFETEEAEVLEDAYV